MFDSNQKLQSYHEGDVIGWLDFFLDGVIDTAEESIEICRLAEEIFKLRAELKKIARISYIYGK